MATVDRSSLEMEYRDWDGQPTSITFFGDNVAAADWVADQPNFAGVASALGALLIGVESKQVNTPLVTQEVPAPNATDSAALRDARWRFIFRDDVTNKPVRMRVGTADVNTDALRIPGSQKADMSHASWVAFKNALIAFGCINPATGNTMTLYDAELIDNDAE